MRYEQQRRTDSIGDNAHIRITQYHAEGKAADRKNGGLRYGVRATCPASSVEPFMAVVCVSRPLVLVKVGEVQVLMVTLVSS